MTIRRTKVLIVGDDRDATMQQHHVVSSRQEFLAHQPVASLVEAEQATSTWTPDLLLLDTHLPDGDGLRLLRNAPADAFAFSLYADGPSIRRALHAGALGYIVRPFSSRLLHDRLDKYLQVRDVLSTSGAIPQARLDRAISALHATTGLEASARSATEQAIIRALGSGEASAAEIAEATGMSPATAQRHLTRLSARGALHVRRQHGVTGRATHLFSVPITPP